MLIRIIDWAIFIGALFAVRSWTDGNTYHMFILMSLILASGLIGRYIGAHGVTQKWWRVL